MNTNSIPVASAEKTLDLLWSRVRQRGDLPGFSKVVNAIMAAMHGEHVDGEFNMTKTVLSDPALTQKVLRLANSPMYAVFGGNINTVSKAVIVLGTDSIGHLALGLKLIDGLAGAALNVDGARAEMEKAVLAGHIARHVASSASTRDAEEAVVCSMLHTLGRMMVTFYLADQWTRVLERCAAGSQSEALATREVFGLGLDEIGRLIARQWGFPMSLVNSLQDIHPASVGEPLDHADWLAAISTMSTRCAFVLHKDPGAGMSEIGRIAGTYAEMLGMDAGQMLAAVESARRSVEAEEVFARPVRRTDAVNRETPLPPGGKPDDAALILTRGVADMRGAANSASTGQLITMALETVYKGFGLSKAIVFLHSNEAEKYLARMCFGEHAQELMARLAFDDAYQPDVFHAALANDKMIFVENARAAAFVNKLPRWWKDAFPTTRSFMVLPLTVNGRPAGFIYGDWDDSQPHAKIEPTEILPLNELRVLVVNAVEQRRHRDAGSML